MESALYTGSVRHRRFTPKQHKFEYQLFMLYINLKELDDVLALSPFWSKKSFFPARFKREDFHGDSAQPLLQSVKNTVEEKLKRPIQGDIFVLANLRYFGFNMNPLTTYYCYDEGNKNLQAILAEVNNTPWNERHAYVLDVATSTSPNLSQQQLEFNKVFSVSPFNYRNMQYRWHSTTPGESLHLHIDSVSNDIRITDATLRLKRKPITATHLNTILLHYPFMTVKVFAAIYWQALRLFLKGVPFLGKDKIST